MYLRTECTHTKTYAHNNKQFLYSGVDTEATSRHSVGTEHSVEAATGVVVAGGGVRRLDPTQRACRRRGYTHP